MCDRLQAGEINPTVERGWRRGSETYRSPVHPGGDLAAAREVEFGERFGVLILASRRPDSGTPGDLSAGIDHLSSLA